MKQKRREELGLLDYLAGEIGCQVLSEMRQTSWWPSILEVVERTDVLRYGTWEWNEAVNYIIGISADFATQQQAQHFLVRKLSG